MDTKIMAPHILNAYVWAVLKTNIAGLNEADYGNRRPIIPSSQEPEFMEYNSPFLVYGFAEDPSNMNLAQRSGTLVYAIYSDTVSDINNIQNILIETLGRMDETARDINAWSSTQAQFIGCRFGSVSIAFAEGAGPADQEGGRQAGTLTIRYNCVLRYTVDTIP